MVFERLAARRREYESFEDLPKRENCTQPKRGTMLRNKTLIRLLAGLCALVLITAACSDDDDGGDTTETSSAEAADVVHEFRPLDPGGPLTKQALLDGDIDVALLFTSDADIAVNEWVLLEDDQSLQQIENLIPAIGTEAATPEVTAALNAVSAPLTTAELTELNRQSSVDAVPNDEIATTWLTDQGLLPYTGDAVEGDITIGSTNFNETEIVAEIYAAVLESAGATVDRKFQLGAREIVAPALESGEIDLAPEYISSYTVFYDPEATVPSDPAEAADALNVLLEDKGVMVLEAAPAEDRNGLVVTAETAAAWGVSTTSDLLTVSEVFVLGGPPECPEREFCLIGYTEVYGLMFG
jgi:osmoprotectant transport system substrate-binding protein